MRPHHCAAIPFRGQTAEGERWIDCQVETAGPEERVYLSETAVREAARLFKHPDIAEHVGALEELEHAYSTIQELNARIAELETFTSAFEIVAKRTTTASTKAPTSRAKSKEPVPA